MKAGKNDAEMLAPVVMKLWPEHTEESLVRILRDYASGEDSAVFACCDGGRPTGVALCTLRHDYVEGCDTSPVGYLEGVYVEEAFRLRGTARALTRECEAWAKTRGCSEFASDCELSNAESLRFHLSAGFEEANRVICFRKTL